MSTANPHQLHVYFLPMMAPGHTIPMIDIARQFARNGAKATIISTPLNASHFSQTIERDRKIGLEISISLIEFPCQEAGLPEGCENLSSITTPEMVRNFCRAMDLLQEPVEKLLRENHPDAIVAGLFFWWANDLAQKFNIPRLQFYGTGFFPMCLYHTLKEHKPHENVESECEEFVMPGLPDEVKLTRRQLSEETKDEDKSPFAEILRKIAASQSTSLGIIVNSFYELEPAYARHYREVIGRKAWHVGPVSLFNKSNVDKTHRGLEHLSSDDNCLSWLNSKKPNSVVYVCFGSMATFSAAQLLEIAKGLESSGQEFVWVVREKAKDKGKVNWLPDGFESRIQGRGLIINGWAPQVLILEHEAVGGFVTHCGWNSILEGVTAGVPMVTWPLSAEQFLNEKLVTEILKTGTPVGAQEWTRRTDDQKETITGDDIEKAVVKLMVGEEGERMRIRARELGDMAKRAVEKGGSSDADLKSLMEEIRNYHP
ncbi:scopoletin glucosyltransferase-like [Sesamum indicum]|uniref:Glycosyltransferase n=1 Tax=Sesamum indicum TaxID=4182 RepID=A0A6I9TWR4_SESIN|nr:scopoletin glucosyltransferase-like [Sesamum indicum]